VENSCKRGRFTEILRDGHGVVTVEPYYGDTHGSAIPSRAKPLGPVLPRMPRPLSIGHEASRGTCVLPSRVRGQLRRKARRYFHY
jgi:hypothetical protein